MLNSLAGFNNRSEQTKERISELEGRSAEISWCEEQTGKKKEWLEINRASEICGAVSKVPTYAW